MEVYLFHRAFALKRSVKHIKSAGVPTSFRWIPLQYPDSFSNYAPNLALEGNALVRI